MTAFINSPHLVYKVWGGPRLFEVKNVEPETDDGYLGETWEVSTVADCESHTDGKKLSDVLPQNACPYLIKFIDTSKNLSVQVHPTDDYAKMVKNISAKTECWVVLAASKGAGIYLGTKSGVTKDDFFKAAESGENVSELLRFFPVAKGDFFFVPAGTIHAIGENVLLAEVQQSSGVTYRVWDWNRVDFKGQSRELHLKEAKKVANFASGFNQPVNFKIKANAFHFPNGTSLIKHPDFRVRVFSLRRGQEEKINLNRFDRLTSILLTKGTLKIFVGKKEHSLESFNSLSLIEEEEVRIVSQTKSEFLVVD